MHDPRLPAPIASFYIRALEETKKGSVILLAIYIALRERALTGCCEFIWQIWLHLLQYHSRELFKFRLDRVMTWDIFHEQAWHLTAYIFLSYNFERYFWWLKPDNGLLGWEWPIQFEYTWSMKKDVVETRTCRRNTGSFLLDGCTARQSNWTLNKTVNCVRL